MNIVLGSKSTQKLNALHAACATLGIQATITGISTSSGVNEQPLEFFETYEGAFKRARAAKYQTPSACSIGIESGLFAILTNGRTIYLDMAVIVIITDNGEIVTTSSGFEFPAEYVIEARNKDFKTTTVGSIIAQKLGGDGTDPHAILSNGKVTRSETLTAALITALKQI